MEDGVSHFFTLLGHPLRRKIIQYLGEHRQGGFTDLKAYLNVSTGTLYYQLEHLGSLIEQDEERKYRLNEKGKFAYQLLLGIGEKLTSSRFTQQNPSVQRYVTLWLTGWKLIAYLYGMSKLSIPFTAMVLLYGIWVTNLSGLYPVVFIYVEHLPISSFYIPLLFILGWLLINALVNLVSYFAYRTSEGVKYFFLGSAISLLPALILPTVYVIAREIQAPLTNLQAQIIMLIGIGYSLCLLASAISLSKGLVIEKAALSASITLYASLGLAFILTTL